MLLRIGTPDLPSSVCVLNDAAEQHRLAALHGDLRGEIALADRRIAAWYRRGAPGTLSSCVMSM